ncbi:MAG: prepilin peptidase [Bdellovibrionales bacterium]|nr:prepilin peptidase [Bdellovibrionales bacterium]
MPWFDDLLIFVLGALLGSFANVLIYRVPRNEEFVKEPSHCTKCGKPIRWYHNIPILAWFILRGKCASCGERYSFRYPLVEMIMAGLFLAVFMYVGPSWTVFEYLIFTFFLVVVSFIDFDHMILPHIFTLSGIVVGLIGAAINPEREFLSALYGVLLGGGFLWAIAHIYLAFRKEEGMGGGDIKLLAWIGAVLGWKAIPFVILGSSIVGSVVGLLVSFGSKNGLKTVIPFGPYLALAAIVYILGGQVLGEWYISLFFPTQVP